MTLTRSALLLAVLLPLAGPPAVLGQADTPLSTDRPDFTEGPSPVAAGRFQLEAGYTFTREDQIDSHSVGEVLFRIGLVSRVELRAALNSYAWLDSPQEDANGLEDASLGLKLGLMEAPEDFDPLRPQVGLLVGTTLPTGEGGFGEDGLQPEVKLALGWDLSDRLSLGSNLNYAYASEAGDRFSQFSGSLALGVSFSELLGGYLEFFGFVPASSDGTDESFLNGGVTLLATDNLQFDARVGLALNDPNSSYFAGLGFAVRR